MKAYALIGVGVVAFAVSALALYLTDPPMLGGVFDGQNRIGLPPAGPVPAVPGSQVALQADLAEQRGAHRELARTVANLERRIDLLTGALPYGLPGHPGNSAGDPSALALDGVESAMVLREPLPGSVALPEETAATQPQGREQQRQRLVAAGFSLQEIDEIIRVRVPCCAFST